MTEQGIAERMGTSAGPVREAFARLSSEGLLVSLPHRGTFVASVPLEEARSAYALRSFVEPYAARLMVPRLNASIIERMTELTDQIREGARHGDYSAMVEPDMQFHALLYSESGSSLLVQVWAAIEGVIRAFVVVAGPQYDTNLDEIVSEHDVLLDLIKAGDADALADALGSHGSRIRGQLQAPDERPEPQAAAGSRRARRLRSRGQEEAG